MRFYHVHTKKQDLKEARDFLKTFNVRLHFVYQGWSWVDCGERLITIDHREATTRQELWSILFHELSHIYCYENNLYYKFHHDDFKNDREAAEYMHRYALRAERFVDKKAKWLMSLYLPDIPYKSAYDEDKDKEWFRKWLRRTYPLK